MVLNWDGINRWHPHGNATSSSFGGTHIQNNCKPDRSIMQHPQISAELKCKKMQARSKNYATSSNFGGTHMQKNCKPDRSITAVMGGTQASKGLAADLICNFFAGEICWAPSNRQRWNHYSCNARNSDAKKLHLSSSGLDSCPMVAWRWQRRDRRCTAVMCGSRPCVNRRICPMPGNRRISGQGKPADQGGWG